LSVLSPQGDALYSSLRPTLALSGGTAFTEDSRLFWHPALDGLKTLYSEKKVTVLPAVGYNHPDQSHFTSRHYWEVGATDADLRTGWLGRYLDKIGTSNNPLQGLSLDDTLAPALATASVPVASISTPDDYSFYSRHVWGEVEQRMLQAIGSARQPERRSGASRPRSTVSQQVDRLRHQLLPVPVVFEPGPRIRTVRTRRFPKRLGRARGDARRGAAAPLRRASTGSRAPTTRTRTRPAPSPTDYRSRPTRCLAFQR
jgi:hypothetical protein